jgi:hypothetical protein
MPDMSGKPIALAVAVASLLLACGCARQVPLDDLAAGGGDVGVFVRTAEGEDIRGQLVSLTGREMVVVARHAEGGVVAIQGFGDDRRVVVDGVRIDGEVVGVDRVEGVRVARVRRTLRITEIERATFHRSGGEASLAAILSLVLGPSVGGLLALVF